MLLPHRLAQFGADASCVSRRHALLRCDGSAFGLEGGSACLPLFEHSHQPIEFPTGRNGGDESIALALYL